jgi:hypothetical protein
MLCASNKVENITVDMNVIMRMQKADDSSKKHAFNDA